MEFYVFTISKVAVIVNGTVEKEKSNFGWKTVSIEFRYIHFGNLLNLKLNIFCFTVLFRLYTSPIAFMLLLTTLNRYICHETLTF